MKWQSTIPATVFVIAAGLAYAMGWQLAAVIGLAFLALSYAVEADLSRWRRRQESEQRTEELTND